MPDVFSAAGEVAALRGECPAAVGEAKEVHSQAANLASAHHAPVAQAAAGLVADLAGVSVSAGWMGGVRHNAADRLGPFMGHVSVLLRQARVLYADETPARAARAPGIRPRRMHRVPERHAHRRGPPPTSMPTACWTATRASLSAAATSATYLTDALHTWCVAHNLRDLYTFGDLYTFDPRWQVWVRPCSMR